MNQRRHLICNWVQNNILYEMGECVHNTTNNNASSLTGSFIGSFCGVASPECHHNQVRGTSRENAKCSGVPISKAHCIECPWAYNVDPRYPPIMRNTLNE